MLFQYRVFVPLTLSLNLGHLSRELDRPLGERGENQGEVWSRLGARLPRKQQRPVGQKVKSQQWAGLRLVTLIEGSSDLLAVVPVAVINGSTPVFLGPDIGRLIPLDLSSALSPMQ